jgi:hypothetical protein
MQVVVVEHRTRGARNHARAELSVELRQGALGNVERKKVREIAGLELGLEQVEGRRGVPWSARASVKVTGPSGEYR